MELKYMNSNGEIVVASNLHPITLFVLNNYENWVQKQILYVIFSWRCFDCYKSRFFITLTSLIQIRRMKAFNVDINIFYEGRKM